MNEKKEFNTGFVFGFLGIAAFVCTILTSIWTQMLLWNWFVSPLGLTKINFFHSAGLMVLAAYFKADQIAYMLVRSKPEQKFWLGLWSLVITFSALILGWLIHFLI